MTIIPNAYFRLYLQIRRSIVFVPSIISTSFLAFALLVNAIENIPATLSLKGMIPYALVADVETARMVLAILIGGLISLTVFSFSMVMVSINQASAALSPSVVPALIADPFRQRTLGIYLGTITFYLILTLNISPPDSEYSVPQLGILISYVLAIVCLTLFIHFISSISRSLQVDTILQDLFDETLQQLRLRATHWQQHSSELSRDKISPDDENWQLIQNIHPGYFKSINEDQLIDLMTEFDFSASVQLRRGEFSVIGKPLVKVSKELPTDIQEQLAECFVFYIEEFAEDHYSYGIKQIAQIGAKALSPGINDPMTAIKCIQLLSLIFIESLKMGRYEYLKTSDSKNICYFPEFSMRSLVFITLTPLCKYAECDAQTLIAMVTCLKDMISSTDEEDIIAELVHFTACLAEEMHKTIKNQIERDQIDYSLSCINALTNQPVQHIKLLSEQ